MKRNRFIRGIVPLALTVLAVALCFGCGGGYRSISVATITGEAAVSRAGQSAPISCYGGMKLQDQDELSVSDDGGIVLKLDDDKYVYLEPDAKIRISASGVTGKTNTTIELISGTMSAVIEQKLAQNESFRVTVDNVSMVVRGTIFRISRGVDESGKPTVTVQTVEGTVGVFAGDGAEQQLDEGLQDVVLLTDTVGTFAAVDEPIDYTALPQETLDWIRGALTDKLGAATDPAERETLEEILAILDTVPPEITPNEAEATPTATPKATPTPTPGLTPTPGPTYLLTLRKSYFGSVLVKVGTYPAGAKIPVSVEPRHGYEFNGWMINGASAPALGQSSEIVLVMPDSDTMIAARFRKATYWLSIDQPAMGGVIVGKSGRYEKDAQVPLSVTPSAGYAFTGWMINGTVSASLGTTNPITFIMPDAKQVIGAQFALLPTHNLTFEQAAQGGGTISLPAGAYYAGATITVTVVPDVGMKLASLVVNGVSDVSYAGQTSVSFIMPDADVLLSAVFEIA